MHYGYGPYTGCPTPATGAGYYDPRFAMSPYHGYLVTGAEEAAKPSFLDKLKEAGEVETFGVKRKFLALGAVGIGAVLVLSAKGMI